MNQIFFELFYEGINTEAQQIVREVTMQVLTSFASVYAFTLDAQLHVTTYRCAIVLRGLPSEFTYQPINVKGPKITASKFVLEKFSQQGGVLLQKDGYYYLEKEICELFSNGKINDSFLNDENYINILGLNMIPKTLIIMSKFRIDGRGF